MSKKNKEYNIDNKIGINGYINNKVNISKAKTKLVMEGFENKEIKCSADFGTIIGDKLCCGQPGILSNNEYVCPEELPICQGYEINKEWGICKPKKYSQEDIYKQSINLGNNIDYNKKIKFQKDKLNNELKMLEELNNKYIETDKIIGDKNSIYNERNNYISIKNNKLLSQKKELEKIEETIMLKDKLIDINNNEYKRSSNKMMALLGFFPFLITLSIPYYMLLKGSITNGQFSISITILIIIYMIYVYEKIYQKKTENKIIKDLNSFDASVKNDIYKMGRKLENDFNEYIEDCDCPEKKKHQKKHHRKGMPPSSNKTIVDIGTQPGLYYYDGTAPQERIIPKPYATKNCPLGTKLYNNTDEVTLCCKEEDYNNGNCGYESICAISENATKYPRCGYYIDWETSVDMGERSTGKYMMNDNNKLWRPGNKKGDFALPKVIVNDDSNNTETCDVYNANGDLSKQDLIYLNKSTSPTVNL